jgi:hypothetical protein
VDAQATPAEAEIPPFRLKRWLLGSPLPTQRMQHERLPKVLGLAVFSSDALSSVAYAPEEILLIQAVAGTAVLSLSWPIALAIVALLGIVSTSYRQTIHAYPSGGGAYGLDQGSGHFRLFEVDAAARAPAPPPPISPRTARAAAARQSAQQPSCRQVEGGNSGASRCSPPAGEADRVLAGDGAAVTRSRFAPPQGHASAGTPRRAVWPRRAVGLGTRGSTRSPPRRGPTTGRAVARRARAAVRPR